MFPIWDRSVGSHEPHAFDASSPKQRVLRRDIGAPI